MTLLFNGRIGFFAERGVNQAERIIIHLPKGAALLCNSIGFYAEGGSVHIPARMLHPGENRLQIRIENRLYPCESLFLANDVVTPMGLPMEEILLAQHEALEKERERTAALLRRVEALEQKTARKMLFS